MEAKRSYRQNWSAYTRAQTREQILFMRLLSDLCQNIEEPKYKFGRPKLSQRDMIFVSGLKVYSRMSLRRFCGLMKISCKIGLVEKECSYVSVSNFMRSSDTGKLLIRLIELSSLPLASIEQDFAIDSTGFSICRFDRWFSIRHKKYIDRRMWMKAHVACGVKTNIVTAVKITGAHANDSPHFKELLDFTAKNFKVREVSADRAYNGRANFNAADDQGAVPFIPFRSNTKGKSRGSRLWRKMYHYFLYNLDEFAVHYHKRSNVETTFHMIKTKFGDALRSKTSTAQANEILLKILCHNICVIIQEMHELGIAPKFYTNDGKIKESENDD